VIATEAMVRTLRFQVLICVFISTLIFLLGFYSSTKQTWGKPCNMSCSAQQTNSGTSSNL
jgi:hypothetical protein